ncbi:hypothetical protein PFISCL1PPCAC_26321, partial [Pristionchus fissidentatus]
FPAIICYFCVGSTLIMQRDIISNYTLAACPNVKSGLPPISYSIGVWEPQKQIWMFALMLHIPARLLLIMMVPQQWHSLFWRFVQTFSVSLELLSLILVTIFHVDSILGFKAHAAFFGIWWGASIWGMSIVIYLQRLNGLRDTDPVIKVTWWIKVAIMVIFFYVSVAASIAYPISQRYCNLLAFIIFCACEYLVVGLNAGFWAVALFEFEKEFDGFQVTSVRKNKQILSTGTETPTE